ncbi:hypothetical protein ACHAW6_000021 [Cyclotella cf. meneghiniana]
MQMCSKRNRLACLLACISWFKVLEEED